ESKNAFFHCTWTNILTWCRYCHSYHLVYQKLQKNRNDVFNVTSRFFIFNFFHRPEIIEVLFLSFLQTRLM
ncbi:hypothetical protein EDC96DRAFT_438554, partial [Choanephora cucurbitarum]